MSGDNKDIMQFEMAKKDRSRSNQKLKMMYLYQILLENTDATHSITVKEIIDKLDKCNVTSERKSIYDDISKLTDFGVKIKKIQKDRTFSYCIENRQFTLPELKLLVDSVQGARFITEEKCRELIKKIEKLASKYEAQQLQRQVHVSDRTTVMSTEIFDSIDAIHKAMTENKKIEFQYFQWNTKKEKVLRHNGQVYSVSPWGLCLVDNNYYLVAKDSNDKKHYRVDKMLNIRISNEMREKMEDGEKFNITDYSQKTFNMFHGVEKRVELLCSNDKAGIIIDRFGHDLLMRKVDDDHFKTSVKVATSELFFGWVLALGDGVKITGPQSVVDQLQDMLARIAKQYEQ